MKFWWRFLVKPTEENRYDLEYEVAIYDETSEKAEQQLRRMLGGSRLLAAWDVPASCYTLEWVRPIPPGTLLN